MNTLYAYQPGKLGATMSVSVKEIGQEYKIRAMIMLC